jgi:hypothetical protein
MNAPGNSGVGHWARALSCVAALLCAGIAQAATISARDLIGTWRLLRVEVEGPGGTRPDPFYNAVASGLLIYDASGWVSVQIVGTPRPKVDAPATRPASAPSDAETATLKAALVDTYYAYFGTWEFDARTSTVTHKVKSALYSGEEGASYAQQVQLVGRHLVFSRTHETAAGKSVQRKIWERVSP